MKINGDEQHAAEELDTLLTVRLTGQTLPASNRLSETEATLASELVELAEATQPTPGFVANLSARLEGTARNPRQTRWSFLQNSPARRQTMFKRMTIALVGAVVLAVTIFLALPLLSSQQNLPPLPSLAMMSAYAQGGGTSGSSVFPGTTFILSTTPARVTVYRQSDLKPLTVAEVQHWAERFGLHGQVYRQRIQPGDESIWRATVFDGSRQLTMTSGDWINYADTTLQSAFDSAAALPLEQITDKAMNFLQSHGLLDFPYRVEPVPDVKNMVRFARLVNDNAVQNGYIQVGVTTNGQVATVEYHPLILEPAGEYPIRSAQMAWDELTSGQLSSQMQYTIHRDAPSGVPPAQTKYWRPQYRPGQRADLYGSITVYQPADGSGALLIKLNEFELRGNVQGLTDQLGVPLHIWGMMRQDGRSLDVTGWEKDSTPLFSAIRGTIKRDGGIVLLRRDDGKIFLLPNAPDDLPDGIAVSGGGRETNRTENNYPILDWTSVMSPPNSLPSFSQFDGGTSFQGNPVVVPVQTITPSTTIPMTPPAGGPVPVPPPPLGQSGPVSGGGYSPPIPLPTPPLASGQRVDGLEGWLQAYMLENADGKTRTLVAALAEMSLSKEPGWAVKLIGSGIEGLGQYDRLRVRVWGRFSIQDEQPTIVVERYEKAAPDEHIQAWLGQEENATIEGQQVVLFQTREGQRYILASSFRPSPPPAIEKQLLLEGVMRPETIGGYRVIEQISSQSDERILAMTDLKSYQPEPRPPVIRSRQPMPGKAYVERVELIYYAIAQPLMSFSFRPFPDASLRVVQPLWKFTGHTQDGASFEILVQAVSDQYVR